MRVVSVGSDLNVGVGALIALQKKRPTKIGT
jgi:hypothetical protein